MFHSSPSSAIPGDPSPPGPHAKQWNLLFDEMDNPAPSLVNHATLTVSCINRVFVYFPGPLIPYFVSKLGLLATQFGMRGQEFLIVRMFFLVF